MPLRLRRLLASLLVWLLPVARSSPSTDYLGQRWNNWHSLDGDGQVLPGEHLDDLQTTTGEATSIDLVIAGGLLGERLFASRDDAERRVTRFRVTGAATASATVQTSGAGAAGAGGTANDDDVIAFAGVQPDAWAHVFVDLSIEEGSYAYLSLLELPCEAHRSRSSSWPASRPAVGARAVCPGSRAIEF